MSSDGAVNQSEDVAEHDPREEDQRAVGHLAAIDEKRHARVNRQHEEDRLTMLDSGATRRVVDAVEASEHEEGIRLRVRRERREGTMETTDLEEVTHE